MDILNNLSKQDLIRVIANMHDTIQDWDNGYGLPKEAAEKLIKIGSACASKCVEEENWDLPKLEATQKDEEIKVEEYQTAVKASIVFKDGDFEKIVHQSILVLGSKENPYIEDDVYRNAMWLNACTEQILEKHIKVDLSTNLEFDI